jgi:CHAT domain-containing protein
VGTVRKICVSLLLLLICDGLGYGQGTDTAERELNDALVQYAVRVEDLNRTRGVSRPAVIITPAMDEDGSYLLNGAKPITAGNNISRSDLSTALKNYPESTAVLFYSYLGDSLRIWLIDKDGLVAFHESETSRFALNTAIANLRSSLQVEILQLDRAPTLRTSRRKSKGKSVRIPLRRATYDLSKILLPRNIALNLTSVRHLIVAPIMGIGTVPFALLQPFGDRTYLIDKMSVSVAPSVYDVVSSVEKWNSNFHSPLVIGNPYFPPSSTWQVPPLPGAEAEALYVGKSVNTKALIGRQATKNQVVEEAKNSDFLYFATHGVADNDNPLTGGFLLLSAKELEQGWWTAKEIQQTKLNARIAVLSACQTGLGRVHDAGVIGLSRAFQIAGVPRVAMSLWSVDDEATSQLMRSFVDHCRGNVPSEALRLAMLDVRKHQPHPSKWAAFVLFGTPR